jgi:hypothetical protein
MSHDSCIEGAGQPFGGEQFGPSHPEGVFIQETACFDLYDQVSMRIPSTGAAAAGRLHLDVLFSAEDGFSPRLTTPQLSETVHE